MAEYEPEDSRVVTRKPSQTPGEPPRTGPREQSTRAPAADEHQSPSKAASAEPRGAAEVGDD
jgi:hypothetical protein